jgi:hypothetical protein
VASPAATPARGGGDTLSDIGPILDSPLGWAVVILVLGWPVLLAGGVAGLVIGWLILRRTRPWLGSIAGVLAGVAISVAGVFAYADGLIGP